MDEKRLAEIEERWRKQLPLKIGEIDDLLAEVKRLREALRDISHGPVGYWNEPQHREEVIGHLMKIAMEALK